MIKFEIKSNDAVSALEDFADNVEAVAKLALDESFDKVAKDAKIHHRFKSRTGTLKNAIKSVREEYGASVYVDESLADYGKYIHDGFGTWAPDKFLDEALADNEQKIVRDVEKAISKEIRKEGLQ